MVLQTADNDRLAVEILQDAAEVVVQFVAQFAILQEWATVLRGKHSVNKDLSQ